MSKLQYYNGQLCLSEALDALNCDSYAPEYKVTMINREREDYIQAFSNKDHADPDVLRQFDEMLTQLPR